MIRSFGAADIDRYVEHLKRHLAESGRGSTPFFTPYSADDPWDFEARRKTYLKRWSRPLSQPNWERMWGAFEGDRLVGHTNLTTEPLKTNQHRANLGMGIEAAYRKRGLGEALLRAAIDWARRESALEWIDLCVFTVNTPAQTLYRKLGFTETGRVDDAFRIDGVSVGDIQMTLNLKRP